MLVKFSYIFKPSSIHEVCEKVTLIEYVLSFRSVFVTTLKLLIMSFLALVILKTLVRFVSFLKRLLARQRVAEQDAVETTNSGLSDLNQSMESETDESKQQQQQQPSPSTTLVKHMSSNEVTRQLESTPLRRNVKRNATKIYYTQEQLLSEVDKVLTHLDQE
jgi:hypothetical protein